MTELPAATEHRALDRTAGIGGVLTYGLFGLLPLVTDQAMSPWWWVLWALGLPVFVMAVLLDISLRLAAWLLLPMAAVGIGMYLIDPLYGFGGVPMVITAACAGLVLPLGGGLGVVALQSAAMLAVGSAQGGDGGLLAAAFYIGLQVFAVMTGQIAQRETRAREQITRMHVDLSAAHRELGRAYADLEAAQARLAETSRTDERLRISRDLHDLVGHQLSALAVNLEVASHLSEGRAGESVDRCRTIARDLLADVRRVVSRLREERDAGLRAALTEMAAAIPVPQVRLDLPDDLPALSPELTDALVHCVQEMLTNAVRHSGAAHAWVSVSSSDGVVCIRARDDGRGAARVRPGNGLTGMRERVAALNGTLRVDGTDGFEVTLTVPVHAKVSS